MGGGYSQSFRENVMNSACQGFAKIWKAECQGTGYINRPSHVTKTARRAMRLAGSQNWFKKKTQEQKNSNANPAPKTNKKPANNQVQPTESVLFLPYTPNSSLKKTIQEIEGKLVGRRPIGRVRIVERAGPTIFQRIGNKSPWTKDSCG